MALVSLKIEHFRCLSAVDLAFDGRYNLFVGPNASGKTSLLEAIFFLGRGRSFRTRRLDRIVQQGATEFMLVGRVRNDEAPPVTLGIRASRLATEIRVGGAAAGGAGELATHFPPQVIDPEIHKLLEEGPARRRRFLDWGVFHVEQGFMAVWQRYHRALRQRNAALKSEGSTPVDAWDQDLASAGEALAELRSHYLRILQPELTEVGHALLGTEVAVAHQRGWSQEETLPDALRRHRDRDLRSQQTNVGPHRADVSVRIDGYAARERVSRGQQKLLAAALTLAQLRVQQREHPGRSALLLDDPAAELDGANLERLVSVVRTLPVQLFVTALHDHPGALGTPGALFHVERGRVRREG